MSQSTDELLDALNDIEAAQTERPASQADHLLNALQSKTADSTHQPSPASTESLDMLLEEVEEPKQTTPKSSATPHTVDAIALALEAAKAAQEAADNSQKSAEIAIKNANELKAQTIELSDANFGWRQTVRTATNEIKSAKNSITLLTVVSVSFALVASTIMGYALFSLNKKYETLKTDIADILQTQNTLFQNKINTKVDELASLVEYLSSEIKTLQTTQTKFDPAPIRIHSVEGEAPTHDSDTAHTTHQTPHHTPSITEPSQEAETSHSQHSDTMPHAVQTHQEHEQILAPKLAELHHIVQQILTKQQALEQIIQKQSLHSSNPHAPQTVVAHLSPEEQKQLKAIRWLVSQQNKRLKHIEATLLKAPEAPAPQSSNNASDFQQIKQVLNALQKQVEALQTEQTQLRQEVKSLKDATKALSIERPYFYRATGGE